LILQANNSKPGRLNNEEVVGMHEIIVNKLRGEIFTDLMEYLQTEGMT